MEKVIDENDTICLGCLGTGVWLDCSERKIEKCDNCEKYESDEEAYNALVGIVYGE